MIPYCRFAAIYPKSRYENHPSLFIKLQLHSLKLVYNVHVVSHQSCTVAPSLFVLFLHLPPWTDHHYDHPKPAPLAFAGHYMTEHAGWPLTPGVDGTTFKFGIVWWSCLWPSIYRNTCWICSPLRFPLVYWLATSLLPKRLRQYLVSLYGRHGDLLATCVEGRCQAVGVDWFNGRWRRHVHSKRQVLNPEEELELAPGNAPGGRHGEGIYGHL